MSLWWRRPRHDWVGVAARMTLISLVPLVLVLSSIRALLTEEFLQLEYERIKWVESDQKLDPEVRLGLAKLTLAYLGDKIDQQGLVWGNKPIYTNQELSHLRDVKILVSWVVLWHLAGVVVLGISVIILASNSKFRKKISKDLALASGITLGLVIVTAWAIQQHWERFFVMFHQSLFADGTWLFTEESTLIRLFPESFWVEAAVALVLLTAILATGVSLLPWGIRLGQRVRRW